MSPDRESFSDLLRQSVDREISRLQERPESIVVDFVANEKVAQELGLADNLNAVSLFLTQRLGIPSGFAAHNIKPVIKDPDTMMTRVEGEPEYSLVLGWEFDGKEKSFKLIVESSGEKIRILNSDDPAIILDSHKDGQLNYDEIHKKISDLLFSQLDSRFRIARLKQDEEPTRATA